MSTALILGLHCPARALVMGATGGIGLALVELLLERAEVLHVTAVARQATQSAALAQLVNRYPGRLQIDVADLTDPATLQQLAARLSSVPLHLCINAAGVLHQSESISNSIGDSASTSASDSASNSASDLMPEKNLAAISSSNLHRVFAVNAFGPVLLAQAILPLMRHAEPAVFASLSARVGSIGDNRLGGWYAYRAAKAAHNQLLKTVAIEGRRTHPNLSVQMLHPGTVDSALSRPFQRGVPAQQLFTPAYAAAQLLAVIGTATAQNSGRFVAWDGSEIPW